MSNNEKDNPPMNPEDIKNRVILRIERAEIMAAMLAMKGNNKKTDEKNSPENDASGLDI